MKEIEYLGQTLQSKWLEGDIVTQADLDEVRNNFYKTTKEQALKQLKKILLDGGVMQDKIYKYYFEKIANDTLVEHAKWTINQLLASDEILAMFIRKARSNPKVFSSKDLTSNVRTAIRLGGKGYARAVTQFPLKENIRMIDVSGECIGDMACGWGTRMLAAAVTRNGYAGFEVNPPLIKKLNELGHDIQTILPDFKFVIFEHGSEILQENMVGKIAQIITSPPYFDLEAYTQNGDEVYSSSYKHFRDSFLLPMFNNAYLYLKNGGSVLINLKDTSSSTSMTDITQYAIKNNLYVEHGELKNIQRTKYDGSHINNDEDVLIVYKNEVHSR